MGVRSRNRLGGWTIIGNVWTAVEIPVRYAFCSDFASSNFQVMAYISLPCQDAERLSLQIQITHSRHKATSFSHAFIPVHFASNPPSITSRLRLLSLPNTWQYCWRFSSGRIGESLPHWPGPLWDAASHHNLQARVASLEECCITWESEVAFPIEFQEIGCAYTSLLLLARLDTEPFSPPPLVMAFKPDYPSIQN
jgi:hypothetical protein